MEQEIDKEYSLRLMIKKRSFLSTVKDQSDIHRILENARLASFSGLEIYLQAKEEIDDLDFDKTIFLFESQKLVQNSMKHIVIKSEIGNYLTPLTYQKILSPFGQNLEILSVFVGDDCGKSINDWLFRLEKLASSFSKLGQLYFEVQKYFRISFLNGYFLAQLNAGMTQDEESFKFIANICGSFNITSFKLKIGDDNIIKAGVEYFAPKLANFVGLNEISIKIGQSCQMNPQSPSILLQSIGTTALKSLKISIGNSNQLSPEMLPFIVLQVQRKLEVLKIDLGSSTKIFNQSLIFNCNKKNQLKHLVFYIGKNNCFQFGGAKLLAHLINSSKLEIVKISIGDFNQMTELQSLQVFLLLQRLRNVKQLELSFERNISVNNLCIFQLEKLIEKNCNLSSLSLNFLKQQEQLQFHSLFQLLGRRNNLINLDMSFGGLQILPDLQNFGELLSKLQYLSTFSIHLKGNNNVEYDQLKDFLKLVKSNLSLNLLSIKTGSQSTSEQRNKEFIENASIIRDVLLVEKPIVINFNHLNEQLCYQYNFDRLFLNGIPEIFSQNIYFPIPSNQLTIRVEQKCSVTKCIKQICAVIREQEEIEIKVGNFQFFSNSGKSQLRAKKFSHVQQFVHYTKKCIQEVQVINDNNNFINASEMIFNLVQRILVANDPELRIELKPVSIVLHNKVLNIIVKHENQNSHQALAILCKLLETLSYFSVSRIKIVFSIANFSQQWDLLKRALNNYQEVQELDICFITQSNIEGTCFDYLNFHSNLLNVFINNIFLTSYDYFNEQIVFPTQLQFHIGEQIKELEENIKAMEQQLERIQNGNPIDGDQNVHLNELDMRLQNSRKDLAARNNCIEVGKKIDEYKRSVLLTRSRLINQYYIASSRFFKRNYKTQIITDILEMLV